MTKVKELDIAKAMAEEAKITKAQARDAQVTMVNEILLALKAGKEVTIRGMGTFTTVRELDGTVRAEFVPATALSSWLNMEEI